MSSPAILQLLGRPGVDRSARTRTLAWSRVLDSAGVVAAATLLVAAGLTANVVLHDAGHFSLAELADLALALGWIAFAMNAGFAALLLLAYSLLPASPGLRRLRPWLGSRAAFLAAGLPALHLSWVLLNRLPRVQLLFFEPVFVTPAGLAEAALVALSALGVLCGVLAFGRRAFAVGAIAAASAALLVFAALLSNGRDERAFRKYSMERVHAAAARALETGPAPAAATPMAPAAASAAVSPPVIVLALDGWGWDAIVPLLEAGRLPNTAALVAQGATGYLDNGDDSYSPRIWNTVFTGRPAAEHGVHDFFVMRLSHSGRTVANLVSQTPAIDTFYGLKQLTRKLPSLGLWELVATTSHDVAVKPVWSVASDHGRRVVVANVLNTVPALPVNGAMFTLQDDPGAVAFYPAALSERWQPHSTRATGKRPLAAWDEALVRETAFTLSLFAENDVALGVYYTNAVDRLAHRNWDFHARDRFLATRLPDALPDAEWESFVAQHADESFFGAYAAIDEQIGHFRSAYPNATFVVLSDHGWTLSGYSHYGSQDGIVLVSGPRANAGATIPSAHVRDVAPTLLALLGIPLSDELPGGILREALAETPRVGRVASYGAPGQRGELLAGPLDPQTLRDLAAIGYAR